MTSNHIDSTQVKQTTSPRRRRWTWITIGTVGVISASLLVAVPAIAAENDQSNDHSNDRVIVCESSVETNGDVSISSAVATRLPEGDNTPVPEGCREE